MPSCNVKDAGTWKSATPKVKDAGSWKTALYGFIKDAGVWTKFFDPTPPPPASLTLTATTPQVNSTSGTNITGKTLTKTCFPAVSVSGATGTITYLWTRQSGPSSGGAFSAANTTTSAMSVTKFVYDSDTYSETWRCTATDSLGVTGYVDVVFTLSYTYVDTSGGCTFCCFAPGTPVIMADGTEKAIEAIVAGELILTDLGPEVVTGSIEREDRELWRLTFDDGRTVDVTEDHPFYVAGKGYASLNPTVPYKDIGMPALLWLGDRVATAHGPAVKLVSVDRVPNQPKVYTLNESGFYANGLLVA